MTGKLPYNAVLGIIGVLILINQDMPESRCITLQHIGMFPEKQECVKQQVIKIHGIRLTAALLVTLEYLAHHGNTLELVMLVDIGIPHISRCRHQTVLGIRYAVLYHTGLICLLIQLHLPDNGLDKVLTVSLVVYCKIGGIAYLVGL